MKYNELNLGQMEAIVNKLGGMEGVHAFLSGETVVTRPTPVFKTWRTLKLGTGLKDADDFRTALTDADCSIGEWGNDILDNPAFTVSSEEVEVELVNVSVAELGFKNGATRAEIYERAKELSLDICPAEVGPQLRLQYKDQPESEWLFNEWLLIAMDPITVSDGDLGVLRVSRCYGGERLLGGYYGDPGWRWGGHNRWVFLHLPSSRA